MAYVKRIVCLANSYKIGGACIAGKEVVGSGYGAWIRPVSARPTGEVRLSESSYRNGGGVKLLDIIEVRLSDPAPRRHQTENHVIDTTQQFVKTGELPWSELPKVRDRPATLWTNNASTGAGAFDCMTQADAATHSGSLALIVPEELVVEAGCSAWDGKRTYRCSFTYNGKYHSLSLTDPAARRAFDLKREGSYRVNGAYACVSVTEPYSEDGRCHKLVAAIFTNPPL